MNCTQENRSAFPAEVVRAELESLEITAVIDLFTEIVMNVIE